MNKIIIAFLVVIVGFFIIKDYQARMIIVNANYQCNVAGIDEYCNLLNEIDMRGEKNE